jgi:hypothetical protein
LPKFAWTCALLFIKTLQVMEVPVQAPVQLTKVKPGVGVAVSVTVVPWLTVAEQLRPQSMPT